MKIILINPPKKLPKDFINYPVFPHLGILLTAAVLRDKGCDVHIIDAIFSKKNLLFSKEGNCFHFGIGTSEIISDINRINPDVVVIANNRFFDFASCIDADSLDIFRQIKEYNPSVVTILADFYVGGYDYILFDPKSLLNRSTCIDMVSYGESEISLLEIIESISRKEDLSKVRGIGFRKRKNIIINKPAKVLRDLDSLSYPAYDLMNMENFFSSMKEAIKMNFIHEHSEGKRTLPLFTSRGCPYSCIFCASYLYSRGLWRAHSPVYILRMVKYFLSRYNVEHFIFMDENINADIERFENIISRFISNKLSFSWSVPNGFRADKLNRRILSKMKKTGIIYLVISAETGVQRNLDRIVKKRMSLDSVIEVAKNCKDMDIPLSIHYIIGLPGEEIKDINKTLSFAKNIYDKYNARPLVQFAVPIEGTELFEICKKNNYISNSAAWNVTDAFTGKSVITTEAFGPYRLKEIFNDFHERIKCGQLN